MSLGQFGDLALVTSFLLWVYSKSLAAKDILKEVVLGTGVFFLHLVPLIEATTSAPITLLTHLV